MTGRLQGRIALVTGGGRGIGRAISESFAREGAKVGVLDLKPEIAGPAVEAIRAAGGEAIPIVGNVAKRADLFGAVAALQAAFGPVTVLVNNAMWNRYGPLEEQTEEMIARMIDVGLKGVIWGYQAVLTPMSEAGGGAGEPRQRRQGLEVRRIAIEIGVVGRCRHGASPGGRG